MSVSCVAVLLSGFGSDWSPGPKKATVAELMMHLLKPSPDGHAGPGSGDCSTTLIEAVSPFASESRWQKTVFDSESKSHVHPSPLAETKPAPEGTSSVTATPVESSGPLFVTSI